jgi:uncharacterized membrane protein
MARRIRQETTRRYATVGSWRGWGGWRFQRRMPRPHLLPWPLALALLVVVTVIVGRVLGSMTITVFRYAGDVASKALSGSS